MLPKYLYKFQKLKGQTLRNLKNDIPYFCAPASFNDPFDCSGWVNDSKVADIISMYLKAQNIPINSVNVFSKDVPMILEKRFGEYQSKILHNRGCSCFSKTNKDNLMWSHYADGHKGICLKFDSSFPPFSNARRLNYCLDFPVIDPT